MALAQASRLGHYEIISFIGAGGMGEVYKARDLRLQRDVALKVLPASFRHDAERQLRLRREAKAVAALNHPHICTLHDVGHDNDADFLVLEYLEGTTLAVRLTRGPLPYDEVIGYGIEVAEALAEAHRLGLIHRDLKPSNIMLTAQGAKLLDFGLAKAWADAPEGPLRDEPTATALTEWGSMLGTLRYMAPEQVEGLSVDPRTDIFAFGAVVYEMIAGQPAFLGATKARISVAVLESDPVPLNQLRPGTPVGLTRIVKTCLSKRPVERWQSAADLAAALRAIAVRSVRRPTATRVSARKKQPTIHSLAVLPLEHTGGDTNKELVESMTDALVTTLSRVGRLKVVAGPSCIRGDGAQRNPTEVARELSVDAVIRGAVSQSSDRLRVNAELLYPAGNLVLWSDTYEQPLVDLHSVPVEIAETIAAQLWFTVTPGERRRTRTARTNDRQAEEAYVLGRYYWNRETADGLRRSFRYLVAAIQKDPGYALAHAAMADWYWSAATNRTVPSAEALPKARAAALRALELDPGLAEAHACLGRIASVEWDLKRAVGEFDTALQSDPLLVDAILGSARSLTYLAEYEEAVKRMEVARQLDPVSPKTCLTAATIYYAAGHYARVIEECQRVLEFEPHSPTASYYLGLAHHRSGDTAAAIQDLRTAERDSQNNPSVASALMLVLTESGHREEALQLLDDLKQRATRAEVSPYDFAEAYMALGESAKALDYLRRSCELHIPEMIGVRADPFFEALRGSPEFEGILHTVGLTPAL
jgi:eukaryotic-like serine/threonine-protein kinase